MLTLVTELLNNPRRTGRQHRKGSDKAVTPPTKKQQNKTKNNIKRRRVEFSRDFQPLTQFVPLTCFTVTAKRPPTPAPEPVSSALVSPRQETVNELQHETKDIECANANSVVMGVESSPTVCSAEEGVKRLLLSGLEDYFCFCLSLLALV